MTRQKKELIKKINDMHDWIEMDIALGCGFAPDWVYAGMYKEIGRLQEELARLQHYGSVDEMMYDDRWMGSAATAPC